MTETIRAFIGIRLPENMISFFREIQDGIKAQGLNLKLVRPENIHITLKFLGYIDKSAVREIGYAMEESGHRNSPIILNAKGLGCFPTIRKPRILWVGLGKQIEKLKTIQKNLDQKLETLGFPKENRTFKGHLTIGRVKKKIDTAALGAAIETFKNIESEDFIVDRIILFQSTLKSSGPVYEALETKPIGSIRKSV